MSEATDRAVDRLIEAAPAAADHVVRYMVGYAWAEIIGGVLALALTFALGRYAAKRQDCGAVYNPALRSLLAQAVQQADAHGMGIQKADGP